ncbi:chorismate mutase [Clostridium sp.]|uniref:chorismate mutase n=1 Tax=Clostridium sp. TaxID=1506 RepID=UPI002608EA56|nr:chorismate mutase [Clostridium sp.]
MKCENLEQVRENIDIIDKKIVKLIAERSTYVVQAASFKKNSDEVKAAERVEKIISKVRGLANEHCVNPDIVEKIYREMISSFINFELAEQKKLRVVTETNV